MNSIMNQIKGGLIVSCQALEHEPLHSAEIMARMAYAAKLGGAVGIRANSVVDIKAIKEKVDLPLIGIIKKDYPDSKIFITATMEEVDALVEAGCEIIATDATCRTRPNGESLDEFFKKVREKYPNQLFMADCATFEEGMHAAEIGFDFIGTTLSGYTEESKDAVLPNYQMMERLVKEAGKPVIAEGGIWSPEQLKKALDLGVLSAVVGTAITRPMEITQYFIKAISN